MIRGGRLGVLLLAFIGVSGTAQAQTRLQGYGTFGGVALAASETFDAVAGTTSTTSVGGGVRVVDIWHSLFVDLSFSRQRLDAERVFVSDGAVFPLDIPLDITFQPTDVTAGWRFDRGRFAPYVGGGVSWVRYQERSPFAASGDDVDERGMGGSLLAGVDVPVWRFVSVGAEVRYRVVGGVLGNGGASAAFGEDNVGGAQYAVRVSVGR